MAVDMKTLQVIVFAKAGHGQMKHSIVIETGINGHPLSLMNLRIVHDYGPI